MQWSEVHAFPSSQSAAVPQPVRGTVVVVVLVDAGAHPPAHASQQLVVFSMQALAPAGATHAPTGVMLHLRNPVAAVTQQGTVPARPHVERTAQRMTAFRQRRRSAWSLTARFATPTTQPT